MHSQYAHRLPADISLTARVRIISLIGPAVIAGGLIWAVLQPYRLTILHPRDQGFWWLLMEPQLLVVLEAHDAAAR
jgi:hypothetical protein